MNVKHSATLVGIAQSEQHVKLRRLPLWPPNETSCHMSDFPYWGRETLAVVDTVASLSLLRGDRARKIMLKQGRPFILAKCNLTLVTLSDE